MTLTLGAVLLVGAVVFFLVQPLVTGQAARLEREPDEVTETEARRRVKLLALRDVEYDFATGKLDESDYRELRRELSAEALRALDDVERQESGSGHTTGAEEALEEEIARVRAGLAVGATCDACGHVNPEGSRFCSICGAGLSVSTAGH